MRFVWKFICLFSLFFSMQSRAQITLEHLTAEMAINPLGITQEKPKLGWQLVSKNSNVIQKYYQVLVPL